MQPNYILNSEKFCKLYKKKNHKIISHVCKREGEREKDGAASFEVFFLELYIILKLIAFIEVVFSLLKE